jgi:tRNA pseudouridine55 synthase
MSINGLVLLNKPPGITSFKSLSEIKRRLAMKKVGHTGTLDAFAEGLLLVLIGQYTRLAPLFSSLDKEYIARIEFGQQTDTLDPDGRVVERGYVPEANIVEEAVNGFQGTIEQVPPLYSAVHYKGKRAYQLIRMGETFELSRRKVSINEMTILSYTPPYLTLKVICSSGTYVRALARDIGRAAGTCAFVCMLTRTRVGNFSLEKAVLPSDFKPDKDIRDHTFFIPLLDAIQCIQLKKDYRAKVIHGSKINTDFFIDPPRKDGYYALFEEEIFCAVIEKRGNNYHYRMVTGEKQM